MPQRKLRLGDSIDVRAADGRQLLATRELIQPAELRHVLARRGLVRLHNGRLQQLDTPAEFYANPANMFVAGFIGSPAMNFFAADLERREHEARVRASGLDSCSPRTSWRAAAPSAATR